jgi:hypothetical protein
MHNIAVIVISAAPNISLADCLSVAALLMMALLTG